MSSRRLSYSSCALRCLDQLLCQDAYWHHLKRANTLSTSVQLTAVQDSHKQLSLKHAQLQAEHNHQTGEFAQAALQLSKLRQELAEVNVDLDTSGFLGQVCQCITHASIQLMPP